jgi:rhodanese-related sulfurtransferase
MKKFPVYFLFLALAATWARSQPSTNSEPKGPAVAARPGPPKKVEVEEFEKLWQDKKNVVLDVRTKQEFDAGHIPGAVNLDVNAPGFTNKVAALDTNKVYLVHCAAGRRSANACDQMSRLGFSHLIDLAPGFRGWEKAGKPVEK